MAWAGSASTMAGMTAATATPADMAGVMAEAAMAVAVAAIAAEISAALPSRQLVKTFAKAL